MKVTIKAGLIIGLIFYSFLAYSCTRETDNHPNGSNDTIPDNTDPSYNLNLKDIVMRDPFVFVDTIAKKYYIHASSGDNQSFTVYESKDLTKWKCLGKSFIASQTFWGKSDFWAPDLFEYSGKYYMIATFSAPGYHRGCSILVSDTPEGPYEPLTNKPITPKNWGCLDGTLVIDSGQPYLLYCHEWLETIDGQVCLQKLTPDLTATVGDPVVLFNASSASWVGDISSGAVTGKVTDAPFIYRVSAKEVYMIWSSFAKKDGKYSIGLARSTSGSIFGPWVQSATPLNDDDGGHAMFFRDLDGYLKISYHAPNTYPNYVCIYDVDIFEGAVTIIK